MQDIKYIKPQNYFSGRLNLHWSSSSNINLTMRMMNNEISKNIPEQNLNREIKQFGNLSPLGKKLSIESLRNDSYGKIESPLSSKNMIKPNILSGHESLSLNRNTKIKQNSASEHESQSSNSQIKQNSSSKYESSSPNTKIKRKGSSPYKSSTPNKHKTNPYVFGKKSSLPNLHMRLNNQMKAIRESRLNYLDQNPKNYTETNSNKNYRESSLRAVEMHRGTKNFSRSNQSLPNIDQNHTQRNFFKTKPLGSVRRITNIGSFLDNIKTSFQDEKVIRLYHELPGSLTEKINRYREYNTTLIKLQNKDAINIRTTTLTKEAIDDNSLTKTEDNDQIEDSLKMKIMSSGKNILSIDNFKGKNYRRNSFLYLPKMPIRTLNSKNIK